MNTTDSDQGNYYFDSVRKTEVIQKFFYKTNKAENKMTLKQNQGKKLKLMFVIKL